MRKLLILLFSILVSLSPYAEIDYFCTDLIYTSFNKYTGKYKVTPGLVAGTSYIKFKDDYSAVYVMERFWPCEYMFEDSDFNSLICSSNDNFGFNTFTFNKKEKRFLRTSIGSFGYIGSPTISALHNDYFVGGDCVDGKYPN